MTELSQADVQKLDRIFNICIQINHVFETGFAQVARNQAKYSETQEDATEGPEEYSEENIKTF